MSNDLHRGFDEVVRGLRAAGVDMAENPGLDERRIAKMLARVGVPATSELLTLYTWRNGITANSAVHMLDLALACHFRENYADVAPLEPMMADLFPIIDSNGDAQFSIHLTTGALFHVDIECEVCEQFAPGLAPAVETLLQGLELRALVFEAESGELRAADERWSALCSRAGINDKLW